MQAELAEGEEDPSAAAGVVLFEKLRHGRRATKPASFPDGSCPFMWRKLSRTEKQEAAAAAVARLHALDLPPDIRGYQMLEEETSVQVLWRAMRDPSVEVGGDGEPFPSPLAPTADELRETLHDDEVDILVSAYLDLEEETGSDWPDLDDLEREQIVAALKKKDAATLLNFGSALLVNYLLTGGGQPETSKTTKSSSSASSMPETK